MGKHATITEIDNMYDITVMQYSNKGIIFTLQNKLTGEEVGRFLWEYPMFRDQKNEIKRFT